MPLHLLSKKSWNVYNPAAIARVKADEEAHEAREAAREQRDQEIDAARRLAILRGETPPPIPTEDSEIYTRSNEKHDEPALSWDKSERRRKRKLSGEDDTTRDIRIAREDHERGHQAKQRIQSDVQLHDVKGNIQLFAPPSEKVDKKHASSDQGPRLADAGGYDRKAPWYVDSAERIRKDAFGRDDDTRKARDDQRLAKGDPLAAMRGAQAALKTKKQEEEKMAAIGKEYRRRTTERRRRHRDSTDDLEGFSLDAASTTRLRGHASPRDGRRRSRTRSRSPRRDRARKSAHREPRHSSY